MGDEREHLYAFQMYEDDLSMDSIHIAGTIKETMIAPYDLIQSINISINRVRAPLHIGG